MTTFEVTAPRGELTEVLKTTGIALARRPVVPILGCVRLDAAEDTLTVSAFDYEIAVSATIDAKVTTEGTVLASHTELAKLLAALGKGEAKRGADAEPVTIRADVNGVAVDAGGYSIPVETAALEDYPSLPEVAEPDATVDRQVLVAEATRVAACAGTDATLPMLCAMRVAVSPGVVTLAATDRFRLAESVLGASETSGRDVAALLPREAVALVKRFTGATVSVGVGDGAITLASDDVVAVARTVDAEFPPYAKLWPTSEHTVTVDRATLVRAVQRAKAVVDAKGERPVVRIAYRPWAVSVTPNIEGATAPEFDAEVTDDAEGELRFSAAYLAEALASFTSGSVKLHATSPNKPMVLTGVAEPGYRHLLMPVRQS